MIHSGEISPILEHSTKESVDWLDFLEFQSSSRSDAIIKAQEGKSAVFSKATASLSKISAISTSRSSTVSSSSSAIGVSQVASAAAINDLVMVLKSQLPKQEISISTLGALANGLFARHNFVNFREYVIAASKSKQINIVGENDKHGNVLVS